MESRKNVLPTERALFWQSHISGWRTSGEDVLGYCRLHALKESSFYWWQHRLDRRDASRLPESCVPAVSPTVFVEVDASVISSRPSSGIDVLLENSRRLCVYPDFDASHLVRVVSVLESL